VSVFERSGAQPDPSVRDQKRDLRRKLLARRRELSEQIQKNQDFIVRATLSSWLRQISPATVAAYVPMIGEPGGPELPAALAAAVPRLLLPIVLPDRDLDWAPHTGELSPAALGLHEPAGPRLGITAITGADVVIVPALAVDPRGMRLGRGGGSYDRALTRVRHPQLVIAVLYDGEFLPSVPAEPHDHPVDGVVIDGDVKLLSSGHGTAPAGR
jgi:5-formyltetrahydrofolate cyclo-ligase